MSDCGVCLSAGCDFGDNEFQKYTVVNKTPKYCCECEAKIPAGVPHEKAHFREEEYSTRWATYHTCAVCAEIAWAFFCDSRMYELLWEYMAEDAFDKLTHACFNKLKTPEAKAELRYRWIAWKFEWKDKGGRE